MLLYFVSVVCVYKDIYVILQFVYIYIYKDIYIYKGMCN